MKTFIYLLLTIHSTWRTVSAGTNHSYSEVRNDDQSE